MKRSCYSRSRNKPRVLRVFFAVLLCCAGFSVAQQPWEVLMNPAEPDTEAIKRAAEPPAPPPPSAATPAPNRKELEKKERDRKELEKKEQKERAKKEKQEKKEREKREKEKREREKKAKANAPVPAPAPAQQPAAPAKADTSAKSAAQANKAAGKAPPAESAKTDGADNKADELAKALEAAKAEDAAKNGEPDDGAEALPASTKPAGEAQPKPAEPAKVEAPPKKPAEPAKVETPPKPVEPVKAGPRPRFEPAPAPVQVAAGTVFETSRSRIGIRGGVGIGGLGGHEPVAPLRRDSIRVKDPLLANKCSGVDDNGDRICWQYITEGEVGFGVSISGGVSVVLLSHINSLLGVSCELQYSFYLANGEYVDKTGINKDTGPWELNEVGVELHSLEIPLMLRVNPGVSSVGNPVYIEAGMQFGFNLYARRAEYINGGLFLWKPNLNVFEIGPVAGAGLDLGQISIGLRGYIGLMNYTGEVNNEGENIGGRPWSLTAGVTSFF
jgi:hypothetical protein